MTIHRRTHPVYVEDCDACRWSSVSVAASSMPTRHPQAANHAVWAADMDRDMAAYKTMRDEGVQPPSILGSHERMMTSETREQAEGKPDLWGRREEFLTGEVPDMGVKDAPVPA